MHFFPELLAGLRFFSYFCTCLNSKTKMKRILLAICAFMLAQSYMNAETLGQETNGCASNFHLSLSGQSKYMWRGIEYGTSPVLFPTISFANNGLFLYAMGGYATNGSHQEVDLGISYTLSEFTVAVNDYYYPTAVGEDDQYFNLKGKETGHWVEGTVQYAPSQLPISLLLSTYFAGADKKPDSDKQAWSSYAEIGGHYDFLDNNVLSLAVGAALNKSFYNDYAHGFSVCNIELKYSHGFSFNKISVPVSVSYIVNPYREKSYVSFSAAFNY